MSERPLVSVVIPAYNAAAYLGEAVSSVLVQEGPPREIIVVDDGSTDDTAAVADSFGNRIRYRRIPPSGGPARPRNTGIAMARGELVALLDADDVMLPGKLAAAVAAFAGRPRAGLLCTDFQGIDGEGRVIRERWLADYRHFRRALQPQPEDDLGLLPARQALHELILANFVGTSSVVCRRETLADVGPFDESLPNSDDRDMWFRIARHGWDFLFIDRPLHGYRKHGVGVTARGGRRIPGMIRVLERQFAAGLTRDEEKALRKRIAELWTGYGWYLRGEGRFREARAAYERALPRGGWTALRGWLLAALRR